MIIVKHEDGDRVRQLIINTRGRIQIGNTEWHTDTKNPQNVVIHCDYTSDEDDLHDLLLDHEVHHELRFR